MVAVDVGVWAVAECGGWEEAEFGLCLGGDGGGICGIGSSWSSGGNDVICDSGVDGGNGGAGSGIKLITLLCHHNFSIHQYIPHLYHYSMYKFYFRFKYLIYISE